MSPTTRAVARAIDDPGDVLRPFRWTAAVFFGAGFFGYLAWALLSG